MSPVIEFYARRDDEEQERPRDVVASIWPVTEDPDGVVLGDPVVKDHPISLLPSNYKSFGSSVTLPRAGQFLVDVRFPNGQRMRRTISVAESTQYKFPLNSSPRPRRSESIQSITEEHSFSAVRVAAAFQEVKESDLKVVQIEEPEMVPASTGLAGLAGLARAIRMGIKTARVITEEKSGASVHRVQINAQGDPVGPGGFKNYRRRWIGIFGAGRLETITLLPSPWYNLDGPPLLDLVLERATAAKDEGTEGTSARLWTPHLRVGDSQMGAMIEYLTRKDIAASHALMGTAMEVLAEKGLNPFAAAAGAYILALNPDAAYGEEASSWPHWVANLSNWFAWLPDGAIAQGWILLRAGERGRKSWIDARANFLEAVRRGLPYFPTGLRLLSDGLTMLTMTKEPDPEVEEALHVVRAAQCSVDRQEGFTTLRVLDWPQEYGLASPVKATIAYEPTAPSLGASS